MYKVKIVHNHWYPKIWGAGGMMIYPWILVAYNKDEVSHEYYKDLIEHEYSHVRDFRKFMDKFPNWLRWLGFLWYFRYQYRHIKNLFKYKFDTDKAYKGIETETRAYLDQQKEDALSPEEKAELGISW